MGFPDGAGIKNLPANGGDMGLITGWGRPLEEEMATHFNILAGIIPWTEEPDGLQSMRSLKVEHAQSDLAHRHAHRTHMPLHFS